MGVSTEQSVGIRCECGRPSTMRCHGHVKDGQRIPVSSLRQGIRVCLVPLCRKCARIRKGSIVMCPKCAAVNAGVVTK